MQEGWRSWEIRQRDTIITHNLVFNSNKLGLEKGEEKGIGKSDYLLPTLIEQEEEISFTSGTRWQLKVDQTDLLIAKSDLNAIRPAIHF